MSRFLQPSLGRWSASWALILCALVLIQSSKTHLVNTELREDIKSWAESYYKQEKRQQEWPLIRQDYDGEELDADDEDEPENIPNNEDDDDDDDDDEGECEDARNIVLPRRWRLKLNTVGRAAIVPINDDSHYGPSCDTKKFGHVCKYARECGQFPLNNLAGAKQERMVIDGIESKAGEWPCFVQVMTTDTHCSGVIVSKWHVLTADHCLRDGRNNVQRDIFVHAGTHHVVDTDGYKNDQSKVVRKVSKTCPHNSQDLTLLVLEEPLTFNDYIQPACFNYEHRAQPTMEGRGSQCYVIGAGFTRFATQEEWEKTVGDANNQTAKVANYKSVERWSMSSPKCSPVSDRPNAFCVGNTGGYEGGGCYGDSGGPVVCLGPDSRWIVIGIITSASYKCQWPTIGTYVDMQTALDTSGKCKPPGERRIHRWHRKRFYISKN